ncbi:MAG TPA: OmpH family outer membrane protein [Longimicrobiales bacterium]|nr:OmpH family outer membrane protein [Longimicrobiales bacterium]
MRKTLLMTMAGLMFAASAASAQAPATATAAPTKIAFVNSQKLIAEAPGAAEARTTIEREMNKHQADLALADDSIKNAIADFQKKQLALSADAREKQQNDIRAKQAALQNRADALEQQMQKRQQDLIKPIMDRINTVLEALRKEGSYTLILDTATGSIVAADPAADLTSTVLARLKAAAPTATAPKK